MTPPGDPWCAHAERSEEEDHDSHDKAAQRHVRAQPRADDAAFVHQGRQPFLLAGDVRRQLNSQVGAAANEEDDAHEERLEVQERRHRASRPPVGA
eukprot:CAMPEP_0205998492 /NCGR_PEP_ID=MMETSP1464-20131121/281_1 /ASSEMBLY_ACC=CAM_ASM_001124 /TAXON_ID=119497 /ORGANISM="Exanthemachrysis gayraliae, Strain RCC1523" /LENGTH=95 /DNA_ID=CAMNT_0053371641 /DNA_START=374 /DNA_END=658 /DNA_ORIENTATION=+